MKTQKHKLTFEKISLVELDNNALNKVIGGTSTFTIIVGTVKEDQFTNIPHF